MGPRGMTRRDFSSPEERLIREAEQHRVFYAANLHEALKNDWDKEVALNYRQWTAQSLLTLGEFDQAAVLVKGVPDLALLAVDIAEARQAETAPDDDHCPCQHFIDGRLGVNEAEKKIELSSYGRRFQFFSKRYGQVVWLYKCALCGHVNAHPDAPDALHATAAGLEATANKQAREILRVAKGQPVIAPANPLVADRNHFPNAT